MSALEGRLMVMIGCKDIREYSSSHQRYAEEVRLLMPVLQPGLRLFPTSRKGFGKMNIFETDTVVIQKVFLK